MSPRTVLVTGATRGIGRHAALTLARAGHHVIATGRGAEALGGLHAEAAGLRLDVVALDVTDPTSIAAAVGEVDRLTGGRGIDALVNNAGYGQMGAVLDVSDADLRRQFDTNVFGLVAVTRAFVGPMIARGDGVIVQVSSVGGRVTFPMGGVYHASKYAVEALSDAMRMELAPLGVRVVVVEPGGIDTGFAETAVGSLGRVPDGSPWAAVYAAADSVIHAADAISPDPTPVSAVIETAVTSRWPRARYLAPWPYRFLLPVLALLPAWVFDAIASRAMGLTALRRPNLPAHA